MAETSSLILPDATKVTANCYPLQRQEVYVFQDGSVLRRDVPYYSPARERLIDDYGVHFPGNEHERQAQEDWRRVLLGVFICTLEAVDHGLARDYAGFFNESL